MVYPRGPLSLLLGTELSHGLVASSIFWRDGRVSCHHSVGRAGCFPRSVPKRIEEATRNALAVVAIRQQSERPTDKIREENAAGHTQSQPGGTSQTMWKVVALLFLLVAAIAISMTLAVQLTETPYRSVMRECKDDRPSGVR